VRIKFGVVTIGLVAALFALSAAPASAAAPTTKAPNYTIFQF
jgi:hypothetical protein